jgi:hypothetical protein
VAGDLETELADVRGMGLDELAGRHTELAEYRERLVVQVERPRPNIGSGPPGRAD